MKERRRTTSILVGLVLFLILPFCQTAEAQASERVTLDYKEAGFVEVINDFRQQTGVKFMYNLEKVKEKRCHDLKIKDMPADQAIDHVLRHFGLAYSMVEGVVVVKDQAQQVRKTRTIKGTVVDENGDPLPGVSVLLKKTTSGVATDIKGNFTITVPDEGVPVLVFTFIGMQKVEVKCTDNKPIKVIMELDAAQLETVNVVETGYGRLPRKDMVGSFTTVRARDVMMPAYSSIDQMLQGKIPGMVVMNSSSRVGAAPKITIRGQATIMGNTDPLWVVDGIIQPDPLPLDAGAGVTSDIANLIGNQISWLNPADIETITVLKDASATAIYGSKASNGVIVVTTKKGTSDRLSVHYSGNFSFRARPNYGMFNYMNSQERIRFSNEAYLAGATYQNAPVSQPYTYEGLQLMLNNREIGGGEFLEQMEFLETVNTDWFDLLLRNAFSHNHNISISGGSKKTTYNASFGYSSNKGFEKGDEMTQFTARLNVNTQIGKRLKLDINMNGTMSDKDGYGPGVSPLSYATQTSRAIPAYDQEGNRVFYKMFYNYPYNRTLGAQNTLKYNIENDMEHSYSKNKGTRLGVSIHADYKFFDWMNYQLVGSITSSINDSEAYAGEQTSYITRYFRGYDFMAAEPGSPEFKAAILPFGGELGTSKTNSTSYNMQHKIVISKTFNENHRLNAMLGAEIRSNRNKNNANTVWGYVPERGEIIVKPTAPENHETVGGVAPYEGFGPMNDLYDRGRWKNRTQTNNYTSFFATMAYSLKDRYVFNANIRSDASNRFGQDANKQFDPTYSFGFSYRMAEERFIKDNISWLDQFNLRGTYGVQGNVVNSVSPDLIARYQGVLQPYNEYYLTISSLPNPHLKWEKTKTWNFGLDVQMFKGINFNIEYYGRKSNAIINQDIEEEYGMKAMALNGGRIENHGIEFSTHFTPFNRKDFAWVISLNASKNWNTSENADRTAEADGVNRNDFLSGNSARPLKKGKPMSAFWSYSFAGLDPETGYPNFNYLDTDVRDPKVDPTTFLVYSGQSEPFFTGGLNMSFRYKSLTLNANFSILLGAKKRLPNPYANFTNHRIPDPYHNLVKDLNERWKKRGDEKHTIIPALYTSVLDEYSIDLPDGSWDDRFNMWANSDVMVVNASFLRCTQLNLSWNMPKRICKKFRATSCSINATVNNPFVIASKKFDGFDPELDNSVMPKIFSWGLSVGF